MPEFIDTHSREVQEIMEQPSKWYINIACTIVLILVLAGILALVRVKLPEVINGNITIYDAPGKVTNGSFGIMKINQSHLNDIRKDMAIDIELASYPANRYGTLHCTISALPDEINQDSTISIKFNLPPQSKTSRDYTPVLLNGMVGNGKIIIGVNNFFDKILKK